MTRMTKSVASPPACNPKLPPLECIIMGALQLPVKSAPLRQVITPFPYCAPTMNPPFLTDGRMITQLALFSTLIGRPSGVPASSLNTCAAAVTRSLGSSALAKDETKQMAATTKVNVNQTCDFGWFMATSFIAEKKSFGGFAIASKDSDLLENGLKRSDAENCSPFGYSVAELDDRSCLLAWGLARA